MSNFFKNKVVTGKNPAVNEKGMPAGECAKKMLKAIEIGKQEVLIGRSEKLSVYLHRFFPGFFNVVIASHPMWKLRNKLPRFFK